MGISSATISSFLYLKSPFISCDHYWFESYCRATGFDLIHNRIPHFFPNILLPIIVSHGGTNSACQALILFGNSFWYKEKNVWTPSGKIILKFLDLWYKYSKSTNIHASCRVINIKLFKSQTGSSISVLQE